MPQRRARNLERNRSVGALDGDDFAKDRHSRQIILLAGIPARENCASAGVLANDSMCVKAIGAASQQNFAAPDLVLRHGRHENRVLVQNVGAHALSLGAETHVEAAVEEGLANGGKLLRISFLLCLNHAHGEWPPRRFHPVQTGKHCRESHA